MISVKDEYILSTALSNERIASEINARLIEASADPAAAQALLDVIEDSAEERREIREYLIVGLTNRRYAAEIAEQLELIVECLGYQAADDVANNADLNAAQAKIAALSAKAKEYLIVAMANRAAAERLAAEIEAAGQIVAGIADATV